VTRGGWSPYRRQVSEPTWRPLTSADLPAWHRTVAAADRVDRVEQLADLEDLADELSSPGTAWLR
jgi:hypothetical protein